MRLARRDWLRFLLGFLRSPKEVGSIAPSSRWLVAAMLDTADIERRKALAELGPGTGVFTTELVRRMAPDARLFVVEINPDFTAALRARISDPRVVIIHGSAADLRQHLQAHGVEYLDCVVSGLPFTSLPRALTRAVLGVVRDTLAPEGLFVTYQYSPVLLPLLCKYFPNTRIARLVLRNLPPALVLACAAR